jgi:hypothetical protein
MGSVMSWFPSAIHVYTASTYDPFKPEQYKLSAPNGAVRLQLPTQNVELNRVTPTFLPFLTSNVYRNAWNNQRILAYNGDTRVELDPVLYRDYRPGMHLQYAGGKYINEADPSRIMTLYDYINVRKSNDCACKH